MHFTDSEFVSTLLYLVQCALDLLVLERHGNWTLLVSELMCSFCCCCYCSGDGMHDVWMV